LPFGGGVFQGKKMTCYVSPNAGLVSQKQSESDEISRLVAEFEANGGKIQKLNPGESSEPIVTKYKQKQMQYRAKRED
jgi:hypothetical protein